mmetsp:Transcript_35364/g.56491  ORF Transcript_35364/g.56491 Transcript_35364/m.56491 type:complete len:184 (+) Transcript_35364:866-1417(+)
MSAGALGQFVASPTDLVKVQMQLDRLRPEPRFSGTFDALRKVFAEGGVKGLWRGWAPNCARAAFVQVGDLTTYDAAKRAFKRQGMEEGTPLHALSSGCAGLVAATLGAPFDCIKTRFMNQPLKNGVGQLYTSAFDCLCSTVKIEGVSALYKGWLPTWLRMAPWSLTFFITFEKLRLLIGVGAF